MAHQWPEYHGRPAFESRHFSPREFNHPELMDPTFITDVLDHIRHDCGFPLRVNSDGRTMEELREIYRREIEKGEPWPEDSSHVVYTWSDEQDEEVLVRAADIEPSIPRRGDGSSLSLEQREIRLTYVITQMYEEGELPNLGIGIETGHWHVDDTPRLGPKRPAFWVAVSK